MENTNNEKCDNCKLTKSEKFWRIKDRYGSIKNGSTLCNDCYKKFGDKWNKRKMSFVGFWIWGVILTPISLIFSISVSGVSLENIFLTIFLAIILAVVFDLIDRSIYYWSHELGIIKENQIKP